MKQFFILGRNPLLSHAEVLSYLQGRGISYKQIIFHRNYLVLDLPEDAEIGIQELGGVMKIGKISFEGSGEEFDNFVKENEIVESEKFTYSVLGNLPEVEDILKTKFKLERKKAIVKHGRSKIKFQSNDVGEIVKSKFQIFVFENNAVVYFGIVEQDYSYLKIKQRDMKKPVRRQELAISPRLAKILINLSQARPGELLLDSFCGVGGILIEALVRGINVYGVDKNKTAIQQCKQNLKWLENNFDVNASWKLQETDARNIPNIKVDAIATEPDLGELQRSKPNEQKAKSIIQNFERKIIPILQKLKQVKKSGAKIVLTMPSIRNFKVDIQMIAKRTGLKVFETDDLKFPINEFREKQFISRDIVVFV